MKDCPKEAVFLAAVSGGADSMAMLSALLAVTDRSKVFCVHVEHGLRPAEESCGDADFVRNFCENLEVNCRIVSIPPGKIKSYAKRKGTGIEAAARFFRRRAFLKEAARLGDSTFILTAHTEDDALELALMRILRGAGPSGLAAMSVKREQFIRPLLLMSRADVICYLKEKNITWREDSTNKDEKFLRNRIRRSLIPVLNECFPSWKKNLTNMTAIQSLTAEFIGEEAGKRICWQYRAGDLFTEAQNFFLQPQIIREEALFQAVDMLQEKTRKFGKVPKRQVVKRFCEGSVSAVFGLSKVKQENGKVILSEVKRESPSESGFSLLIKEPGLYNLYNIDIEVISVTAEKTSSVISNGFYAGLPLLLRPCFNSDFIENNGRKVKKRDFTGRKIICAVDRFGTAAFLGLKRILSKRELKLNYNEVNFFAVKILYNKPEG
ncbi:MAG: tRNA lysidine(34) synthetase TilS [Treponema sp.]|nr:tRNA lysidine(34) synthetase TilS [Treponema sp.]